MLQLNIEIADHPGELEKLMGLLAGAGVDIKALSLGYSRKNPGAGIVKLIVNDTNKAAEASKAGGMESTVEEVLVIPINDTPGGLHAILKILAKEKVNIIHVYSFVSRLAGKAISVFVFTDIERARHVLKDAGIRIIEFPEGVPGEGDFSDYVGGIFNW